MTKWIKASEMSPEYVNQEGKFLATNGEEIFTFQCWQDKDDASIFRCYMPEVDGVTWAEDITHWMPFPVLPKEESNE